MQHLITFIRAFVAHADCRITVRGPEFVITPQQAAGVWYICFTGWEGGSGRMLTLHFLDLNPCLLLVATKWQCSWYLHISWMLRTDVVGLGGMIAFLVLALAPLLNAMQNWPRTQAKASERHKNLFELFWRLLKIPRSPLQKFQL